MENKYNYVVALFNRIYNVKNPDYHLHYGIDGKSAIQIKKGQIDFFEKKEKYDIKNVIWKEWHAVRIPFLFDRQNDSEVITYSNGSATINYDIIASAFFFLSNWQELDYERPNDLHRFPYESSIQFKLDIMDKPIVNYYFDILKEAIEKTSELRLKPAFWKDNSFCTFISHDIDTCESAWIQGSFRALLKGDIKSIVKLLWLKLFKDDAWFNFKYILSEEKKLNIRSTFFFLGRKGRYGKFRNSDYDIRKKKFHKVFQWIRDNNSGIGIHGSLGSSYNHRVYEQDIMKFNFPVTGNRFHFLEFDVIDTIEVLGRAKIEFDSTMGFAEHYGFRNGICFPFFLYDIKNDKPSGILEIPMMLMDGTLQNTKYMNLEKDQIDARIKALVQEIKKFNGLFTVLWHNTHYSEYKYKGWEQIIRKIIDICKENNSLFLNGQEITATFKNKL